MQICFATNNENKVREVQSLLPDTIEIRSLKEIGCNQELEETQPTIEGNSNQKAEFVYKNYNVNVFADDTGLEIDALDGEPGVKSARYAGDHKNNEDNIDLVLSKLNQNKSRSAQFKTVVSLYLDGQKHQFEGIAKGQITEERIGKDGFGYDSIFLPEGFDETFAQMSMNQKNQISHRGKAIDKLIEFLKNQVEK